MLCQSVAGRAAVRHRARGGYLRGRVGAVSPSSDAAELSSLRAVLDDLVRRVDMIADRYRTREDTSVSTDLENADRSLVAAGRSVDRALRALHTMDRCSSPHPRQPQSEICCEIRRLATISHKFGEGSATATTAPGWRRGRDRRAGTGRRRDGGRCTPGGRAGSAGARTGPTPRAGAGRRARARS